jgi:putative transposase
MFPTSTPAGPSITCAVFWTGTVVLFVHWDLRESMREADIEVILERAKEKYPQAKPRIISDNGPQFIARGFKEFIRISGMTHVGTSPYYPQSNGKIERWHKSLKSECIRPGTPLSLDDALRLVQDYVAHYNEIRLNSAIGYITPKDMLAGRHHEIHTERDRKLAQARQQRQLRRQQTASNQSQPLQGEQVRADAGYRRESLLSVKPVSNLVYEAFSPRPLQPICRLHGVARCRTESLGRL